jgi:hypothetical protein
MRSLRACHGTYPVQCALRLAPLVFVRPGALRHAEWSEIEHRLFSFITRNWRGKPLLTHQVIVNLICATTTKTGLLVKNRIDERIYPKGRRISDQQLASVNMHPHDFHGERNYTIHPTTANDQSIRKIGDRPLAYRA